MFPVSEAKRKFAPHGALAQAPGRMNSVATGLATVPVGNPPGIVTVCGLALSTTGEPDGTSPRMSCVVLVPLLETQKGLLEVAVMPHGLTRSGSSTGANPGMSVTRFVCRYADPGAITGILSCETPVGCCAETFRRLRAEKIATPNDIANKARLISTRRRVLTTKGNRICDSSSEIRLMSAMDKSIGITHRNSRAF